MSTIITTFADAQLLDALESLPVEATDDLEFGVIVMNRDGVVIWYNRYESVRAGLDSERVVGLHFFETVAPCTNNYLVGQRFADEPTLDDTIDYVFTLRMKPTPVRIRMLARAGSDRQYLAVQNR